MSTLRSAVTPHALRCEYQREPIGLGEQAPRLSWKLASSQRRQAQAAFQVYVATDPEHLETMSGLVWDSGRVTTQAQETEYDGAPLASSTRYWWKVRIWDYKGREATATSWFETGLLIPADWDAAWIGRDPLHTEARNPPQDDGLSLRTRRIPPPSYLRRSFDLQSVPVWARVYATAHGVYELRLNGSKVGDGELTPGWTDYRIRVQYQTYEVSALLREGENVLGAIISDGWWSGYYGQNLRRAGEHYGKAPEFLAQLILEYDDGGRQVVVTDGNWRESKGPLRYADLLMGEWYDATEELGPWDSPGYDDGDWKPARVMSSDRATLVSGVDEPIRVVRDLRPMSIESRGHDRYVVDLGQNMVGRVRLTIRGARFGDRVTIRHAEILDNGDIYTDNLRSAEAADTYICVGRDVEVFEPRFTVHGFRFVEISGYPQELTSADLLGRVLSSDTEEVGRFACSDPLVTQLQSNIQWSQRGNFLSVPTDCPQRDERLGWMGDAQVFLPTACYNADVAAFFTKWMQDVRDAQGLEGDFSNVAPRLIVETPGAPGWGDAGVLIPWHLYRVYGDRRVLERSLEGMVAWVEYIHRHNPDLLWTRAVGPNYGDWLQPGVESPRDVIATAYFARDADLVARSALALGEEETSRRFTKLHSDIKVAFNNAFVNSDGSIKGGTQTVYLLALAFSLLSQEVVPLAVGHLVADIEAHDRHLTTGFLGVPHLCPILARHGHKALAYELLHKDSYPSWGYSISQGATTIWERWDGWTEDGGFQSANMNSFNHYSLGAVGEWLYSGVAGISQDHHSIAWRDVIIRPVVGRQLTWAQASYDSIRGLIETRWERSDGSLRLAVTLPVGSRARIYIPTTSPDDVREQGQLLNADDSDDIEIIGVDEGSLVCRVGSGRYEFTSPFQQDDR